MKDDPRGMAALFTPQELIAKIYARHGIDREKLAQVLGAPSGQLALFESGENLVALHQRSHILLYVLAHAEPDVLRRALEQVEKENPWKRSSAPTSAR